MQINRYYFYTLADLITITETQFKYLQILLHICKSQSVFRDSVKN